MHEAVVITCRDPKLGLGHSCYHTYRGYTCGNGFPTVRLEDTQTASAPLMNEFDAKYRSNGLPVLVTPFFIYKEKLLGSLEFFVTSPNKAKN
ncbi:hypothetical protein ACTXT7_001398 [Hymenolepis weldensis]